MPCCYEVRALSIYIYGFENTQYANEFVYPEVYLQKFESERGLFLSSTASISACYNNYLNNNDFNLITIFFLSFIHLERESIFHF